MEVEGFSAAIHGSLGTGWPIGGHGKLKPKKPARPSLRFIPTSVNSGVTITATQVLPAGSRQAGSLGSQGSSALVSGHQQPAEGNLLLMGRESAEAGGYHAPSQILPAMRRSLGVSAVRHSQNKGSRWIRLIASPD